MNNFDIAEWILNNNIFLKEKISSLYRPANHLFPHPMQDIYLQQYEDGAIRIIREELGKALPINGEDLMILVTPKTIRKISKDLLLQPK